MALRPHIAVIGAGYAGVTAALTLARNDLAVSLFEAQSRPGGRARKIETLADLPEDNGPHLCLGAYTHLINQQKALGLDLKACYFRAPLTLINTAGQGFRAPSWPAPFHWWGLLRSAEDLSFKDTLRTFFKLSRWILRSNWRDETVAETLAALALPPLIHGLFSELCLAALNTPIEEASSETFRKILAQLIQAPRAASDLLIPKVDLSALYPEPALQRLRQDGHSVYLGTRVQRLHLRTEGVSVETTQGEYLVDAVILATHARGALPLIRGLSEAFQPLSHQLLNLAHERIASLTLEFKEPLRLPFPMMAGTGSIDWIFDRRQLLDPDNLTGTALLTCVQSAIDQPDQDQMLKDGLASLEIALGPLPSPIQSRLIHEKLATLSARPGLIRPPMITPDPRIILSGDYTHRTLPSTLESAVQTGELAAQLLIQGLKTHDRAPNSV